MTITIVMLGKFACSFFLWEGQGHFFGIRIKFHLGRAKGRGKREYGGEAQNEGYICKSPLFNKIQTLSNKLLVRQTSNHHHCDQHAQKPMCKDV